MKTYTRKRPEYQIIADAEDLCRLCLKKAKQSIPIFTDDSGSMYDAKVALRIMICVGLEMSNDDCLPNNICIDCHNELERYYAFRKKCEVSYQKLKSHLLAVRIKEVSSIKEDRTKSQDVEKSEKDSKETSNITFKVNFDGSIVVCNEKPSRIEEKPLVTLTRMKDNNQFKLLQSNESTVQNRRILPRHTYQNNKLSQSSLLLPISTTTTVPASNVTFPASKVTVSACNVTVPSSNVTAPSCNVMVPASNATVAARNVTVPASKMIVPASNVTVPASNMIFPASNVAVPPSNVTVPVINTMVPGYTELMSKELQSGEVKNNETMEDHEVEVQNEVTDADLSTFLSNLLIELGVLGQQGEELVLVDPEIRTVELETNDGRRVAWELMEEEAVVDSVEENVQNNQLNLPLSVTVSDDEGKKNIVVQYASSDLEKQNPEEVQKTTPGPQPAPAAAASSVQDKPLISGACCHVCGRRFASRSACARHVRGVHARARPHVCRVCGHAFSQRVVMLRHELVHQAVRPHQCPQCPKSFTQRGALAAHARSHAPPHARPLALYRCALCTKVFLYASGLTRHMVAHTGRRYQCDGCSRQFKDRSSLNRHIKNNNHCCKKPTKEETAS